MQFRFESFAEFMSMAGHGPYVWACYIAAVIAISYIVLSPMLRKNAIRKQLQRQEKLAEQQAFQSME
ncbi:heme exporter protein CcmD [Pseudoteredinibacter isoporae]|uniref:heme exporter protein CcmD n=1 Tax=Pseudoteredinibacter isoporae TaxID=570281 RepID=UPI003105CB5C